MANPYLALENVSYVLPNGKTLFTHLHEQFDSRHTGLVGRNGIGKTVLARILAGQLPPTSGRCVRAASVHYLAQQITPPVSTSIAALAGIQPILDAMSRIEAGCSSPDDFDIVHDKWSIRQRFQLELERNGLGHLDSARPADQLSGGEAMRVGLIGALLSDADFLILDEPSNHLDGPSRQALIEQLRRWPHGLLVVSHDRQLLETVDRIVELSSLGLRSYGGNYFFYSQCKAQERQNAQHELDQRKLEQQHAEQAMREQRERQDRRQARGKQHGKEANQAKILLDRQKERSEASSGKLRQQHSLSREQLEKHVHEAALKVENEDAIVLHSLQVDRHARCSVAELENVTLPFVTGPTRSVCLTLGGQQRIGIVGPNGCGKSTLLKVMAGQLQPLSGRYRPPQENAYLDQTLNSLNPEQSVLEQIRAANTSAPENDLRMRLAQLGLDAQKILAPSRSLSGGERLKAALACVLYAAPPPQLLLLDEPSNHLDLQSTQALETMLQHYSGTLLVVSHDKAFMDNLALTDRLLATEQGWILEPW